MLDKDENHLEMSSDEESKIDHELGYRSDSTR